MTIAVDQIALVTTSKSAGTTLNLPTASAISAGRVIIVMQAFDNTGTSTPTVSLSKPAGESASWQTVYSDSPVANSGQGLRTAISWIKTTVTWTTSDIITITYSASITAKVARYFTLTGADVTQTVEGNAGRTGTGGVLGSTGTRDLGTNQYCVSVVGQESDSTTLAATAGAGASGLYIITNSTVSTTGGGAASNISMGSICIANDGSTVSFALDDSGSANADIAGVFVFLEGETSVPALTDAHWGIPL